MSGVWNNTTLDTCLRIPAIQTIGENVGEFGKGMDAGTAAKAKRGDTPLETLGEGDWSAHCRRQAAYFAQCLQRRRMADDESTGEKEQSCVSTTEGSGLL